MRSARRRERAHLFIHARAGQCHRTFDCACACVWEFVPSVIARLAAYTATDARECLFACENATQVTHVHDRLCGVCTYGSTLLCECWHFFRHHLLHTNCICFAYNRCDSWLRLRSRSNASWMCREKIEHMLVGYTKDLSNAYRGARSRATTLPSSIYLSMHRKYRSTSAQSVGIHFLFLFSSYSYRVDDLFGGQRIC